MILLAVSMLVSGLGWIYVIYFFSIGYGFGDTGVYRLVRCPNYLGELVIWTGSFIVCFGACCSVWQWIVAAIGYIGIVYVMFSGARRLEIRQNLTYGKDPEYQAYVKKTPILLPFVPIYSVEKHKWLQA